MPKIASFACALCGHEISADAPQSRCPVDGAPLLVRYDMEALKRTVRREGVAEHARATGASPGMWRYKDLLPEVKPVTLGEGWTPLVASKRHPGLLVKDEGANPAGTVLARGFALVLSMARQYGMRHLALCSEDGAVGAFAAYAARGGITAHLLVAEDAAMQAYVQAVVYGADLRVVDGRSCRCGPSLENWLKGQEESDAEDGWVDLAMKMGPFLLEGAKTAAVEFVEQLGWRYPQAILVPEGWGLDCLAIWKAFDELEALGWVSGARPRLYASAPQGTENSEVGTSSRARCAEEAVRRILQASGGRVVALDESACLASLLDWARQEGSFLSPRGAAAAAAYEALLDGGEIASGEQVVLFNPEAGVGCSEHLAKAMYLRQPGSLPTSLPVGGIISPV